MYRFVIFRFPYFQVATATSINRDGLCITERSTDLIGVNTPTLKTISPPIQPNEDRHMFKQYDILNRMFTVCIRKTL